VSSEQISGSRRWLTPRSSTTGRCRPARPSTLPKWSLGLACVLCRWIPS
jgi:hypothetical protein